MFLFYSDVSLATNVCIFNFSDRVQAEETKNVFLPCLAVRSIFLNIIAGDFYTNLSAFLGRFGQRPPLKGIGFPPWWGSTSVACKNSQHQDLKEHLKLRRCPRLNSWRKYCELERRRVEGMQRCKIFADKSV